MSTRRVALSLAALTALATMPVLAGTLLLAAAVMHVWLLPGRMAAVAAAENRLAKLDRDLHRRGQASQPPTESPTAARERLLGRFQSNALPSCPLMLDPLRARSHHAMQCLHRRNAFDAEFRRLLNDPIHLFPFEEGLRENDGGRGSRGR